MPPGRYHRDVQFLGTQVVDHFLVDGAQIILRPIQAETQVPTSQRPFDHDEIGQAVAARILAQEQLQRAHAGNDDAKLGVAETRMIFHQCKRAQVQPGRQGDAVYAGRQSRMQARPERFARRVHGELFHHVDENHAIAALGFHRLADVQAGGLDHLTQIELHLRLVGVLDVVFVLLQLHLDEVGVVAAIGHGGQHGIGYMPDTAQARNLQRQGGSGNIHAHTARHDGNQFMLAEAQAEIIHAFHICLFRETM